MNSAGVESAHQTPCTCKVCGRSEKFDFHVPDYVWTTVVPEPYRNRVVCLSCFDDFAAHAGNDYAAHIDQLYFAGRGAAFRFRTEWRINSAY